MNANPPKAKRDPHAGDKRELAASHKRKELPVDNPAAHEGKTITSESIQKGASKALQEAIENSPQSTSKEASKSSGSVQTASEKQTEKGPPGRPSRLRKSLRGSSYSIGLATTYFTMLHRKRWQ